MRTADTTQHAMFGYRSLEADSGRASVAQTARAGRWHSQFDGRHVAKLYSYTDARAFLRNDCCVRSPVQVLFSVSVGTLVNTLVQPVVPVVC